MATDPGLDALKSRVATARPGPQSYETAAVTEIADGLAHVSGLPGDRLGEVLLFTGGARGFVLNLDEAMLQAAFLDPTEGIGAGSAVTRTGQLLSVPVGEALFGRVVDPLGRPLDDLGPIRSTETVEVERPAPTIIQRDFVTEPVETGMPVVDAPFAVGRGQRELIIGERGTGKPSMAEWVRDRGDHALIVYDLIKHAAVHRELALLSRQPPGRAAYPGGIFYLRARLLERSAKLSTEMGAGSAARRRPGRLRLDYAQYLEMKVFSRFGGFGDDAMKKRLKREERIGALLAQDRYAPLSTAAQVALLAALSDGLPDSVPLDRFATLKAAITPLIAAEPKLAGLGADPGLDDATRSAAIDCVRTAIARLPTAPWARWANSG